MSPLPCFEVKIKALRLTGANRRLVPGRNGRWVLAASYRAYKDALHYECTRAKKNNPLRFGPQNPVAVWINFSHLPYLMDLDGPVKPILDALQSSGIIANDSQVVTLLVNCKVRARGPADIQIRVMDAP